jgi:hypothetical protein
LVRYFLGFILVCDAPLGASLFWIRVKDFETTAVYAFLLAGNK